MANPDIGSIACPHCTEKAAVRKNRNSGLYYACKNCGLIMPRLKGGQEYILTHATMYGPGDPAEIEVEADAAPAPEPEPTIPRGKGGRFFETIL